MGLAKKLFNQTRKPEGFLGKLMVGSMNGGHAKLADWGMAFLPELSPDDANRKVGRKILRKSIFTT